MDSLQPISQAVSAGLGAKRVGTPVSVRIVAHTTDDHGRIEGVLGRLLEMASQWLGAQAVRLIASGSVSVGQITVLAEYPQGQTALVSAGMRGLSAPVLEVMVVGNRGIMSWEPAAGEIAVTDKPDQPLSQTAQQLVEAARQSLSSQLPVKLPGNVPQPAEADSKISPRSAAERPHPPRLRPTKPPFGVLLVAGAQTHQEMYAAALAADRRCRLIGLVDEAGLSQRRTALNEQLARSLGVPLLPDLDQALAQDDVHIVSVCAEPERRGPIVVRCAQAGKHLYLDKPLAASVEEADAIVAAIGQAGVASQMFSLVHSSAAGRLRELVRSQSLGELTAIHIDQTFAKGPAGSAKIDKPRQESAQPDHFEMISSKRELYNVGVYSLVMLDWLLGRRVRRVRAVTANYFFQEHQQNDMEDYAVLLLELEGGITASICAGRCGWRSHRMGGVNRACVVGTQGVAMLDAYRPRLEVWADEQPWTSPRRHPEDPMGFWGSTTHETGALPKQDWITPPGAGIDDVTYFLDCVEQGRASDVSAELAGRVLKVLMAAYQSAASGQFVTPAQ